jgi:hypothetical protein
LSEKEFDRRGTANSTEAQRKAAPMNERETNDRQETPRERERDDVAEPDAPTSQEENPGMSTILTSDSALGVQTDESEE